MKEKELQTKLGIPPGSTLTALVALAEKVSPKAPWDAFELLWLSLPWLKPGATAEQMRYGTPRNVHPFAETGGDLHHFGFLMDAERPTDERPIVYVDPKDDDDATQIVAPNLRDFLGLVALSFAEVVSRSATDADWLSARNPIRPRPFSGPAWSCRTEAITRASSPGAARLATSFQPKLPTQK